MNDLSVFGVKRKFWISILFGIMGLIFSPYGLSVNIGEISIDIALSTIFPILISIAFGWRYGLIAGLSGGAFFPFLLWSNNGWVNVLNSINYLFLFYLLGQVNNKSILKKVNKYYLRISVVLIMYILIIGFANYVLFNPILALNPPFWEADTINYMPTLIINKLLIKESISIVIIVLAADTLLELSVFRKIMGIPDKPWTRANSKIFIVVILSITIVILANIGVNNLLFNKVNGLDAKQIALTYFGIITIGFFTARILFFYNKINFNIRCQLEKTEEKFKSIFENVNEAIFILKDGVIINCNNKSLTIFGCSDHGEIIGRTPADLSPLHQSDGSLSHEKAFSYLDRVIKENYLRFEWQHARRDGSIFEAEVWLNKIDGTEIFVQALVRDITGLKHAERKLKESEIRYRSLYEKAPVGIFYSTVQGKLISVNNEYVRMMGFDSEEDVKETVNQSNIEATWINPDERSIFVEKVVANPGRWLKTEQQFRNKEGKRIVANLIVRALPENPSLLEGFLEDITERKKAEADLVHSEQRLKESQAVARLGSYTWDVSTGFWESSEILDDIFGIDELYIRSLEGWLGLIHPDFREIMTSYITDEILGKHNRFDKEYKIIRQNTGLEVWVHGLGVLELSASNQPVRLIGTISDISDRKISEEIIRNERTLFRTIIDNIPDPIYAKDINGRKIVANIADVQNIGAQSEDFVLNKTDFELFPKDLAEKFNAVDQAVMQSAKPIINVEDSFFNDKGEKTWLLSSKTPILDSIGRVVGLVGIGRDITENKLAEKQISMFAHAIRSVSECISITDMSDNIIFVNYSFLKTYLYEENELLGNSISIVRSTDNSASILQEILPATLNGGWSGELMNRKKDGSEFPVHLSTSVIHDENGNPLALIGVTTDITERKRTDNELLRSKQRLMRGESVSKIGNWELDINSGMITASTGASDIYGVEETLLPLSQLRDLTQPEYYDLLNKSLRNLIEKGEPYNLEFKIKNGASGDIRDIHSVAHYDPENNTVFGIIQDITDQKQMEKALRESEEIYKKVTTLSGYMVFDYNPGNGNMTWSGAIEQLTGYTEIQFLDRNYKKWIESIHPDDLEKALYDFEETTLNNKTLYSEYRYKIKSGKYIWIGVSGFIQPVNTLAGYKVIGIVRDISESKSIEEKILHGVIKSEECERLNFSQELHDGLGPLISAIRLYVQLFSNPESKMEKDLIVGKVLVLLDEASKTLREVSFKLSPLTLQNYGIVPALRSFVERIKESNKIDIIFNNCNIERSGEINETIIYRIICECINNTIKHAQAKTILIEMISEQEVLDMLYIDDGLGFDTEQVLNTPKGVGLLNMQSRIKSINGHMKIKSSPGLGTSIHVKIKL